MPVPGPFIQSYFQPRYFYQLYFPGRTLGIQSPWLSTPNLQGKVLSLQSGFFEQKLWNSLPTEDQTVDSAPRPS
jgi:hypothetical protein